MSEGSALDWLLASDEPAVRYRAMTELLDRPEDDREVIEARRAIPRGPLVKALLAGLEPGGERPLRPVPQVLREPTGVSCRSPTSAFLPATAGCARRSTSSWVGR